jgi:hypothetical protein
MGEGGILAIGSDIADGAALRRVNKPRGVLLGVYFDEWHRRTSLSRTMTLANTNNHARYQHFCLHSFFVAKCR